METVGSWVLNTSLDDVIRIIGVDTPQVSRPELTPDGLQKMGTINRLFPFGPTHLDRPPMRHHQDVEMEEEEVPERREDEEVPAFLRFSSTVIVDLSRRAAAMWEALRDARGEEAASEMLPTTPTFFWPDDKLAELYGTMTIAKDDVAWLADLRPDAVLFYTRWRQFVPNDADLASHEYVPWHPYLMHPFLSSDAIDSLMDEGEFPDLRLIGCDLLGLDSPLRNMILNRRPAAGHRAPSFYRQPKNARLRAELEKIDAWRERDDRGQSFRRLHTCAGKAEPPKVLLEQLAIPPELLAEPSAEQMNGATILRGSMIVFTHGMTNADDVALASVQFVPQSDLEPTRRH